MEVTTVSFRDFLTFIRISHFCITRRVEINSDGNVNFCLFSIFILSLYLHEFVFFIFYPFMASMFLHAKPPKTIRMHLRRDFNLLYVMLPNIRIPIPFFLAVRKYFTLFWKAYQNLQHQFKWTKVICLRNRWFPKKYKIKSFSYLSSLLILNLTLKNYCFNNLVDSWFNLTKKVRTIIFLTKKGKFWFIFLTVWSRSKDFISFKDYLQDYLQLLCH